MTKTNKGEMTKREHIATQVAASLCAYSGAMGPAFGPGDIGKRAVQVADALLAALKEEAREK